MIISGSYHKSGSLLLSSIFEEIYKDKPHSLHKHMAHFNKTTDEEIKNNKCVVIIRNPYEMICSGMRYHQTSDEVWLHELRGVGSKEHGGTTYQQQINSLGQDEQLLFEMNNCGSWTINAMYNDIKNRQFNSNVYVVRLEDLWDTNSVSKICHDIKHHINDMSISYKKIFNSFRRHLKINYHRTNTTNSYTYVKLFKTIHFTEFDKMFPKDLLTVLGYENIK